MKIKLRIAELIAEKEWTAYRLAKAAELPFGTAYKLAEGTGDSISLSVMEKVCAALECQPGDLFEVTARRTDKQRKAA
jgi:putative transcriptional regulator